MLPGSSTDSTICGYSCSCLQRLVFCVGYKLVWIGFNLFCISGGL